MPETRAPYVPTGTAGVGWESTFPDFTTSPAASIRESLAAFAGDVGQGQLDAWRDSIPPLQREVREVLGRQGTS
jgi:hypothetical protein